MKGTLMSHEAWRLAPMPTIPMRETRTGKIPGPTHNHDEHPQIWLPPRQPRHAPLRRPARDPELNWLMNTIMIKPQHRPTEPDQRLFYFLNFFHHMTLKKIKK